tara:strand:- start:2621 stop:3307 length:687 start_codon:yes stop_codon:yes gene_type:complete
MTWFGVIKSDEGRQGKHMSKMFMFLKRLFGSVSKTETINWDDENSLRNIDARRSPQFNKVYATFKELYEYDRNSRNSWMAMGLLKFMTALYGIRDCYNMETIIYDYNDMAKKEGKQQLSHIEDEIMPGVFFALKDSIRFDSDRHILLRDFMYKAREETHFNDSHRYRHYSSSKPYQTKTETQALPYWDRYERMRRKKYGKYEDCLQEKFEHISRILKSTKDSERVRRR